MATNRVTQPRTISGPYDFRTGHNGTGTDIPAGYVLKDDATNVDGVALATANTDVLIGVSSEAIKAGGVESYQNRGKAWVYAGGVVAKGDLLTCDSTSRAVKASAGSVSVQQNMLGRAVTDGVAGDKIEVELFNVVPSFVTSPVVANATAMKAVAAASRWDGLELIKADDQTHWIFSASSSAADSTENLVITPTSGTGRWIRADKVVHLKLAISSSTADAATLFTVPAGMKLKVDDAYWEITADFTGGTSSAIGVSSDLAPHDTKGDLLGGTSGNVLADLTAAIGTTAGTLGASFTSAPKMAVLTAGKIVRFDRITSAFTAGSGFVHLDCRMVS